MTRAPRRTALALTALLLLGGCGGSDTPSYTPLPPGKSTEDPKALAEEKADQRARKRAGDRLQVGDGYWYVSPKGWRDATKRFRKRQPRLDSASSPDLPAENAYVDSVGVWTSPVFGPLALELPELGAAYAKKLRTYAVDVRTVRGKHVIDEREAVLLSGRARFGRVPAVLEQYIVVANEHVFVITFTLAVSLSDAEHQRLVDQVLSTWRWT
jgi:hypothetical protein